MPLRFDPPHVRFDPADESIVIDAPAVGVRVAIGPFRKGAPLRVFVDGRVETSWDDPGARAVRAEARDALVRALAAPAVLASLRHAPGLSPARVRVATRLAAWLYLPAVRHAVVSAVDPLEAYLAPSLARDTMRIAAQLRIPPADATSAVRRTRTVDELRALHDRWLARTLVAVDAWIVRDLVRAHGTTRFPPPPVPSGAHVVHLATAGELLGEGRAMHHCVGSYAGECFLGQSFIYRVTAPERATLELRVRDGVPVVRQLKLAHNGAPSAATWDAVRAWLRGAAPPG